MQVTSVNPLSNLFPMQSYSLYLYIEGLPVIQCFFRFGSHSPSPVVLSLIRPLDGDILVGGRVARVPAVQGRHSEFTILQTLHNMVIHADNICLV